MDSKLFPFEDLMKVLGLSQIDLARYLECNKNAISKVVKGNAQLSGDQTLKTGQLMMLTYKTVLKPEFIPERMAVENARLKKSLSERQAVLLSKIASSQTRLREMKAMHQSALLFLQKYRSMKLETEELTGLQKIWFADMADYWELQVNKYDQEKQYALNLSIQLDKQEFALNAKELAKK